MDAKTLHLMAADPGEFRKRLLIDCDGVARPLVEMLDDWQKADFEALDPPWRRVAGKSGEPARLRAYLERPRGHSKTSDLAVMTAWALFASRHPQSGVAAAADRDQARLLRDAIGRLVSLNPWLADFLDVQSYRVNNKHTESALEILACDVGSSYGLTPTFLLLDEVSHWPSQDLLSSLISAAAKRPSCLVVAISNAGFGAGESWQWKFREHARSNDGWYFSRLDGPRASWITPELLAEQQRILPPKAYSRLWENLWQTESGDALDASDIDRATTLPGPIVFDRANHHYAAYLSGLDLALKRDHSALVTVGIDPIRQLVAVVDVQSWAPPRGGEIDLGTIEAACLDASQRYGHYLGLLADPWQAGFMLQRLAERGLRCAPVEFVSRTLTQMATTLLQVFRNQQISIYPDATLRRDLLRLQIVESMRGFKLTATRDEHGHADRAMALAIVLPEATAWARDWQLIQQTDAAAPAILCA